MRSGGGAAGSANATAAPTASATRRDADEDADAGRFDEPPAADRSDEKAERSPQAHAPVAAAVMAHVLSVVASMSEVSGARQNANSAVTA